MIHRRNETQGCCGSQESYASCRTFISTALSLFSCVLLCDAWLRKAGAFLNLAFQSGPNLNVLHTCVVSLMVWNITQ